VELVASWAYDNWFDLLDSAVILAGLAFTAFELRRARNATLVSNRLAIGEAHRELTLFRLSQPKLSRVKDTKVDLSKKPLNSFESDWLSLKFLHLAGCFFAAEKGQYERPERLVDDIRAFLKLPKPRAAWDEWKSFQNQRFVAFVEKCSASDGSPKATNEILKNI